MDKYDILQEKCDGVVRDMLPYVGINNVDVVIDAVNTVVRSQRPINWAFSTEPKVLLGRTSDGERYAYREVSRLGFYHAVSYGDLHETISEMLAEAEVDRQRYRDSPDVFFRQATRQRLEHVHGLLGRLESLRSGQESDLAVVVEEQ